MALAEQTPTPARGRGRPLGAVHRPILRSDKLAREVGAQIKKHRKLRGMTLLDLALICGTTPQTMQRLETANMTLSLEWLEQIAAALKVEPYQLLGGEGALGRANDAALKARAQTAALRAALLILHQTALAMVPEQEQGGSDGGIDA